jgi:tRNA nucleotidyltransferase (CCA-adding enzyme)
VDDADARARLAAAVPAGVREVCRVLSEAGHQAVTVGGAVRDVMLGREPGDWDVATSARPAEVVARFPRSIPTGLQHGTVTVVMGSRPSDHVEVTTFRGEGAYSDARRPDTVTFGVPLHEDLARRDLTVNAIAYDPQSGDLHDPFAGRDDLAARRLRAVGDPVARFTEDGLRVMRAVRFAAQLEFALEPATEAAIAPALPSLARVSRERISDELRKLLAAPRPSLGLATALRTGIVATIWPELARRVAGGTAVEWLRRVDVAGADDLPLREAVMASPLADRTAVERAMRELKFSNAEIEIAGRLALAIEPSMWPEPTPPAVRRKLVQVGVDNASRAQRMWAREVPVPPHAEIGARVLAARDPLSVRQLAVGGNDLIAALQIPAGPMVGRILAMLFDRVLDDPTLNTRDALLAEARTLELEIGH